MQAEHLPDLLSRYPLGDFLIPGPAAEPRRSRPTVAEPPRVKNELLSRDRLIDLILKFDTLLRDEVHEVSLYAEKFHGKGTAFGEPFDMHALTAAHRTFPHNTMVRVTNVENGKSVTVRISDRGPYVHGRDMDLSLAAFTTIADRSKGKINARFERLGDKAVIASCKGPDARFQTRLSRDVRFVRGIPHSFVLGETLSLAANKPFVVRGVMYPDGTSARLQDFVHPGERYAFKPSREGEYVFRFSLVNGRKRIMRMTVTACAEPVAAE
ncbi:septal ring lytic transglycosylase RlpA family protein [Candidatus Peregrinibacteria bacterium]|nr:septal ring lytic transglycosylase RlpA family protein [Candidatus Peregrinibacteria bacterium]